MNHLCDNKMRKRCTVLGGGIAVVLATAASVVGIYLLYLAPLMEGSYIFQPDEKYLAGVLSKLWMGFFLLVILGLVGFILSLVFCGSLDEEKRGLSLNRFDKIFSEVQIIIGLALVGVFYPASRLLVSWVGHGSRIHQIIVNAGGNSIDDLYAFTIDGENWETNTFEEPFLNPSWVEGFLGVILLAVGLLLELFILLAIVKKIKARSFFRYSIVGGTIYYFLHAFRVSGMNLWKALGVCVLCILLSASWIGVLPVLIAVGYFVPKWMKKYQGLKNGIEEVRSGNLGYQFDMSMEEDGEFGYLAEGIEEIAGAQKAALDRELKTQRLRTDLISNVSHDLKTPLTSMLSYVDLMKKEGVDGEHAEEYLGIIDEKTCRLQKLTEDLFEAAKASSGDMPVHLEEVDMSAIVNQALAEVEDRLASNDIEVIFQNKIEESEVLADGRLLWRVIENLLTNVGKYAMPHTRMYLDLTRVEGVGALFGIPMVRLEVKNTSRESLNIGAEELMERFTRGDASRNTDGSGLGLSIARDLTKLMDGRFDIVIDGDLFKAVIDLPAKG